MTYLFLAVAGCVALWFGLRWFSAFMTKPIRHKVKMNEIERFLKYLAQRGSDKGFLLVEIPGSNYFLQVMKRKELGGVALRADFPIAPWSQSLEEDLVEILVKLDCYVEVIDVSEEEGDVERFYAVGFLGGPEPAVTFSQTILVELFGLDEDSLVVMTFKNMRPTDD